MNKSYLQEKFSGTNSERKKNLGKNKKTLKNLNLKRTEDTRDKRRSGQSFGKENLHRDLEGGNEKGRPGGEGFIPPPKKHTKKLHEIVRARKDNLAWEQPVGEITSGKRGRGKRVDSLGGNRPLIDRRRGHTNWLRGQAYVERSDVFKRGTPACAAKSIRGGMGKKGNPGKRTWAGERGRVRVIGGPSACGRGGLGDLEQTGKRNFSSLLWGYTDDHLLRKGGLGSQGKRDGSPGEIKFLHPNRGGSSGKKESKSKGVDKSRVGHLVLLNYNSCWVISKVKNDKA